MTYRETNVSPEERAIDRPRSEAYYLLKATVIHIQRPGMSLEDVEHAIDSLDRTRDKLEAYADAIEKAAESLPVSG